MEKWTLKGAFHQTSLPEILEKKKAKKLKSLWTHKEMMGLINLMRTESVHKKLDGMIHNHAVWQDVAAQLATVRKREHNDVSLRASVVHVSKHGSLVMHTMASFHKLDLGDF